MRKLSHLILISRGLSGWVVLGAVCTVGGGTVTEGTGFGSFGGSFGGRELAGVPVAAIRGVLEAAASGAEDPIGEIVAAGRVSAVAAGFCGNTAGVVEAESEAGVADGLGENFTATVAAPAASAAIAITAASAVLQLFCFFSFAGGC